MATQAPTTGAGRDLATHHPPHFGRHVIAELPFDRGLSWLAGHRGPRHLHAQMEGEAGPTSPYSDRSVGWASRLGCRGPAPMVLGEGAFFGESEEDA